MPTVIVKTDLRCGACVEGIRPLLDAEPGVSRWSADVARPEKTLTVEGEAVSAGQIDALLRRKGYRVLGEFSPPPLLTLGTPPTPAPAEPPASYFPLMLVVAYIVGVVGLAEWSAGAFDWRRAMNHFMAGFFLVFSFFKLLNLSAFADAYAGYDLVAARWRAWGFAYPFVELLLGTAYLVGFRPTLTNTVTLVVMSISAVGVARTLMARRKIRCACLGTGFNLPMSTVTLVEDGLMAAMAAVMLAAGHGV